VANQTSGLLSRVALNYETDLNYFDLMNPCGLEGKKITSVQKILGKTIPRESLLERIRLILPRSFKGDWEEKTEQELCEISDCRFQI